MTELFEEFGVQYPKAHVTIDIFEEEELFKPTNLNNIISKGWNLTLIIIMM